MGPAANVRVEAPQRQQQVLLQHYHRQDAARAPREIGHVDEKTGRTYWIDKRTGEATWESEHWWTEVPIDEADDPELIGRSYWQQEITKEVQWEKPEVEGWVEWFDEHKDEL